MHTMDVEGLSVMDVKGKKIVVVGLARSGIAAANRLSEEGAQVRVTDSKSRGLLEPFLPQLAPGIAVETGGHDDTDFDEADLVVVSPGVPLSIPPLVQARQKGVEVISEVELGFRLLPGEYIGVTGTNGKSTTTTLIGAMLQAAGRDASICGNIGTPLTSLAGEGERQPARVVELSSFQLEGIASFRPHVAVLLNISPDHLNRYAGMDDYAAAKARIFMNQGKNDFAVVNLDDPRCESLTRELAAQVVPVSLNRNVEGGVYVEGKRMVSSLPAFRGEILPVDAIRIPGLHNLENALAATAAALVTGCDVAAVRSTLQEFPGLPHRMESAGEVKGVRFINDSKGTNVGAVLRSLESLDHPVHLIAGGQGKGTDYQALRKPVADRVDSLVLIGEAADRMAEDLAGTTRIERAPSMGEAVRIAFAAARPGDVVLLSPGCASFDMFADFEERGTVFCAEVRRLQGAG